MVRTTVAFAVIALGATAIIAQAPESSSQLEARDFNNDLELRDYGMDDFEARGDLEENVDIDAREPELFDEIEAREYEADELEARDSELEARAPAQEPLPANTGEPSKTVTTPTPTPTPCTQKELKTLKEQKKVDKALDVLRSAKGKKDLSRTDRQRVKRARKYLRRVRRRRVRAAKRTANKCRSALRKAGLSSKKCKAGANCDSALTGKSISSAKCNAASRYLQRSKKSSIKNRNKSSKKISKGARKSGKLLAASKTAVTGPTCTPASGSSSRLRKSLAARDIVDEEFGSIFAREYEFDDLD